MSSVARVCVHTLPPREAVATAAVIQAVVLQQGLCSRLDQLKMHFSGFTRSHLSYPLPFFWGLFLSLSRSQAGEMEASWIYWLLLLLQLDWFLDPCRFRPPPPKGTNKATAKPVWRWTWTLMLVSEDFWFYLLGKPKCPT